MKKSNGFILVIISGIIFGCMPLFAKIIYKNGCSPESLVFYRSLFAIPLLFIMNKKSKIDLKITKDEFKKIGYITLFGYSSTGVFLFLSYNYIPSGLATSLHFIYPVLVTIGCVIFYKEKLDIIKVICTVLCTTGIFMFVNQINIDSDSFMGIIFASFSGITYAFYLIYLEKSSLSSMPTLKMVLYLSINTSFVVFLYTLITQALIVNMSFFTWVIIIIFSNIVTVGAVLLLQLGVSSIGAQNASILSTTEPITSVILGIIIFNEKINLNIILGIILIVTSVILVNFNAKNDKKLLEHLN